MLLHRGFPRQLQPTDPSALSLAPSRAPLGRERERTHDGELSSTARRLGRRERPAEYASRGEHPRRATPGGYPLASRPDSL